MKRYEFFEIMWEKEGSKNLCIKWDMGTERKCCAGCIAFHLIGKKAVDRYGTRDLGRGEGGIYGVCVCGGGGGGLVLPKPSDNVPISTQKRNFQHPISDQTAEINTLFQIRPNKKMCVSGYRPS